MYKQEFTASVARDMNYTVSEVAEVLDKAFKIIIENLNAGEEVNINNFGRFKLRYHKPRIMVNPRDGIKFISKEKATVIFAPSSKFQIPDEVVAKLSEKVANKRERK